MTQQDKQELVAELGQRMREAELLIAIDHSALSSAELDDIREQLRPLGASLSVVKNTLAKRAAKSAHPAFEPLIEGPTALAFVPDTADAVTALGVLAQSPRVIVNGGFWGSRPLSPKEIGSLSASSTADLRQRLLTALAGLFQARIGQLGT